MYEMKQVMKWPHATLSAVMKQYRLNSEMKGKPQSLARSRLAKTALRWEAGPERGRGQGLADAGYVYQTEWIHNPLAPKGDELVPYDEADVMHQVLWRSLSVSIFSVCPLCSQ